MADTAEAGSNRAVTRALFALLVLGGGLLIGQLTPPGEWYARLRKPVFTPPGWVFAPVWTVLYLGIAAAGWRLWHRARSSRAMTLWWVQLALNFLWSPVFFAAHRVGLALVIVLLLLGILVAFIVSARRIDRASAWIFVPYALWTGYAASLNAAILALN